MTELTLWPAQEPTRATQNATLLEALRNHPEGVTALQALSWLGIYRAGGRVYDLRRMGYQIRTERHRGAVARYFLEGI